MAQPLPPPIFNFGAQNECVFAELAVLDELHKREPSKKLSCCVVASCGTHCLTISSHRAAGSIDAVDIIRSQVLLSELLITAGRTFNAAEFEILLGNRGDAIERTPIFNRILPLLSEAARAFWTENKTTVDAGLIRCGGVERIYAAIASGVKSLELKDILANSEEFRKSVLAACNYDSIKKYMFGFPDAVLQMLSKDDFLGKMFYRQHRLTPHSQLLAQLASVERGESAPDYVLHFVLRGRFPSNLDKSHNHYGAAPPPFLDDALLRHAQQQAAHVPVRYHEGPIQVVAAKESAARGRNYDLLDISNILDMMKDNQMREDVGRALVGALAPGGIIIARWSGTTDPYLKEEFFPKIGLTVEKELTAIARKTETSFVATEIAVGIKPLP